MSSEVPRKTPPTAGVVLCSGTDYGLAKKMADYHLAVALAEYVPVLFVDPPISYLTPLEDPDTVRALLGPRLTKVGERIHKLTTVTLPKPHANLISGSTQFLMRRSIRRAVASLGWDIRAVISAWQLIDVFGVCPGATDIYWWLDDPGAGAGFWGFDRDRLVAGDRQRQQDADLVLAVSESVVDGIVASGGRARFFPNGCDAETMARTGIEPLALEVDLPPPIAGFVGHLNTRTDLSLLEAVAENGISLLLVGPRADGFEPDRLQALCDRPNVCWVGLQPFERLPAFQGHLHVGLVPYANNEFNQASFPLKPLEYLAAGRPVVSTSLPGVRWLDSPDVSFGDEPAEFVNAVRKALTLPLNDPQISRRREFASQHTWRARAGEVLGYLDQMEAART